MVALLDGGASWVLCCVTTRLLSPVEASAGFRAGRQSFPLREDLKRQGVALIAVVYDLVPLTHPQYCDDTLVVVFENWFEWITRWADGYVCISRTTRYQLEAAVVERIGHEAASKQGYGHFYLGAELDRLNEIDPPDGALERIFAGNRHVYLTVGTIEPRKNHSYLLDAFDLLWSRGHDVALCIIGRIGWKCEEVVARIRRHPEFGRRLFMLNDANDRSLDLAYRRARALIFPSHAEGFGLPLVEAMERGLPAMASDIPVFREIGGLFMAYFDLEDPWSLVDRVSSYEQSDQFPAGRPISEWRWIGWRESARQLMDQTAALSHRADVLTSHMSAADARRN
jgi:O-antigen biosynthesis alpha-1,2-rhamnosyltransferase